MRFKFSPRLVNQLSHYTTSEQSSGPLNNRSLNVCLFGPHQSGKTLLCSTITKILSSKNSTRYVPVELLDNGDDERKLGSTINLSFAPINSGHTKVTLIDSPGHNDLISYKIKGLTLAHSGILVVSHELNNLSDVISHELTLAKHFNLGNIVLFLNKSDVKTSIHHTEVKMEDILTRHGFKNNLILSGSVLKPGTNGFNIANCIEQLIDYIDNIPLPKINNQSPIFMRIVQSKVLGRNDTYIIGYVEKGSLEVGQNVTIMGKGREFDVNVSKIVSSPMGFERVEAGSMCELMLRGNRCRWITKGMIVTEPGSCNASDNIKCTIESFPSNDCFMESVKGSNPKSTLLSDQNTTNCFVRDINHLNGSPENIQMYKCSLKLCDPLILSQEHSFALAKGKKLVGLGRVDQILPNLSTEDKLQPFMIKDIEA